MPFILLALYPSASYFLKNSKRSKQRPPAYSYIYGFCLGFFAFIRLNNCAAILAVILIVACDLLSRRQYRALLRNTGLFLFGLLTVTLPVCLYFMLNHTFSEMIDAAFLHNFKYAMYGAASRTPKFWGRYFLFCLPFAYACFLLFAGNKLGGLVFSSLSALLFSVRHLSPLAIHIFTTPRFWCRSSGYPPSF